MRPLLLLPLALPLAGPALAQVAPTVPVSPWSFGLKLGTGASHYSSESTVASAPWTAYTGGLSVSYALALPGGLPSLGLDALLERRGPRPWQAADANNAVLFVPLYLRTGRPAARVHVLLGVGPTIWLSGRQAPGVYEQLYTLHPVEATSLLGLEVRLLPLRRCETTLALSYRAGITPGLTYYRAQLAGGRQAEETRFSWLGATLNVYLHPAARQ